MIDNSPQPSWVPVISADGYVSKAEESHCPPNCLFAERVKDGLECMLTRHIGKCLNQVTLIIPKPTTNNLPQNNDCPVGIALDKDTLRIGVFQQQEV